MPERIPYRPNRFFEQNKEWYHRLYNKIDIAIDGLVCDAQEFFGPGQFEQKRKVAIPQEKKQRRD